jgi:DNA-binding transcriptional ArsR family regulator
VEDEPDVAAVRALAHPLRLQLLDLLRFDGPSTATLLARRVGESSGATSYHLRQLGRYGFIEETSGRGGRDRWWRYRERRLTLPAGDGRAEHTLLAELLGNEAYALSRYLGELEREPEWDQASFFRSVALRLTAAELDELSSGIETLVARLRRADAADAPADAHPVRMLAFGFPLPLEGP